MNPEKYKMELARAALAWYEHKLGVTVEEPTMVDTKWTLWGGVYYAASLYTTIGYGNFFPRTTAGRIVSMLYAIFGIPLVFTILCEWGFLYFTWIEYGWNWESSTSGGETSFKREIESNKPLGELDVVLPAEEQTQTVPMKAAIIFFFMWISLSAFIVRLWEYEWSYFSAFYFFFTSLTTIGTCQTPFQVYEFEVHF
ncbi:Ion channel [Oesophagostomum dentatum]|uniref:Ion channel n=1 Tax=Oesophagostomum dentatum TaxID=61180 RepID=A0A0B1S8B3_OESDE|nr:Ion channel [Oesophagostomum dentatum]